MKNSGISLQSRLTFIYAVFIGSALAVLTLIINLFTGIIFTALVKNNIIEKSLKIADAIEDQYQPLNRGFDRLAVQGLGMYFVHEGYIVSVEDESGEMIWDARSCDMRQCMDMVNEITTRMKQGFSLDGEMREQRFPLLYSGRNIGTVIIETYSPFFFSETESRFLYSINRILLVSGIVLVLLSCAVSFPLSRAVAGPVLKAAAAARHIAEIHSGLYRQEKFERVNDDYATKELRELACSINELAGELEEGERRQKQLLADIAHELCTPLACLQGGVEAMIDGVYRADGEHLESCHEEIIRIANLVRDLYTLTRLEWENITLSKSDFDLAKLVKASAEQFMPAALEKGIDIKLDLKKVNVYADYDRLKQVFINVLSNALRYTDSGSVTIGIDAGEVSGDAVVSIADTGIGIPENDLPHIFERFYRSDKSRSRTTGGSGIGLAIAAAIMSAHGGIITAENAGGTGTVFRIRLGTPAV